VRASESRAVIAFVLSVRLLDFEHRTVSIEHSKNGEGRTVKMTQKLRELLEACVKTRME